jgi:hypothetical protein
MELAAEPGMSEASIRRVHEVACAPQLTHEVWVGDTLQDHVMAGGDYKHHPNHVRTATGGWRATAPVAMVRPEMARIVETASGEAFAALHPVAQAAYLHDALLHVQPFADGNGRAARALASGCLLGAAGVPLLAATADVGVEAVQRAALDLFAVLEQLFDERASSAALRAWRERAAAGRGLAAELAPAMERALQRTRAGGGAWGADLSAATVTPGDPLVVAVGDVTEVVTIDAHPPQPGGPVLMAREARLVHRGGTDGLDAWLDRVVSTLALRVAAELD